MIKPFLITKHGSEDEILALEAKAKKINPLAFLEDIRMGGNDWASNATAFDIRVGLEFILIEETLIDEIWSKLADFGFNVTITEASDDLLMGQIDLTNASKEIKDKIFEYYFATYDLNDILDKVNRLKITIDELTEVDKSILNKKP